MSEKKELPHNIFLNLKQGNMGKEVEEGKRMNSRPWNLVWGKPQWNLVWHRSHSSYPVTWWGRCWVLTYKLVWHPRVSFHHPSWKLSLSHGAEVDSKYGLECNELMNTGLCLRTSVGPTRMNLKTRKNQEALDPRPRPTVIIPESANTKHGLCPSEAYSCQPALPAAMAWVCAMGLWHNLRDYVGPTSYEVHIQINLASALIIREFWNEYWPPWLIVHEFCKYFCGQYNYNWEF